MPTFYAHTDDFYTRHPSYGISGRLTREPSPGAHPVGWYTGAPPEPKRGRWLRVVSYITTDTNFRLWRIVDGCGQRVVTGITDKDTARELLAWLCPKE